LQSIAEEPMIPTLGCHSYRPHRKSREAIMDSDNKNSGSQSSGSRESAAGLNRQALHACERAATQARALGIDMQRLPCGAQILDFGVRTRGGLAAGLELARIAMADSADVAIVPGDRQIWRGAWVQVSTERPLAACMLSQYAGWPVQHEKFFAMGSGPMRVRRGREELLTDLAASDLEALAVGTLECDTLPDCRIAELIADACDVLPSEVWLAVAPTRSLAGGVQVVARSVETCLHKLHSLGCDLHQVRNAYGHAPLPPPTPDFAQGIGRTNDAILYGGHVTLWLDTTDETIESLGPNVPSCASADYGAPFIDIFQRAGFDFYKVDAGLFSPAEVTLVNLNSGRSWLFGAPRPDLIARSFGLHTPQ
jgi:methenyltetrahydromethanopterin cyclohydrolase